MERVESNRDGNRNRNREPTDKVLTTEDTYLIAYLKMKGYPIKPWVCREEPYRVAFDVDGETSEAVESYYSGELVSIRDYVAALKDVRRSMFEFKKGNQGGRRG